MPRAPKKRLTAQQHDRLRDYMRESFALCLKRREAFAAYEAAAGTSRQNAAQRIYDDAYGAETCHLFEMRGALTVMLEMRDERGA